MFIGTEDQVIQLSEDMNHLNFTLNDPGINIRGLAVDSRRKILYWSSGKLQA